MNSDISIWTGAQSRPLAIGYNGAASTPHALASEAAISVMKRGGNAIDAAVAAASVCAVVQPFTSGIGGIGWATVYDAKRRETHVLEFNGCIPRDIEPGVFSADAAGVVDWKQLEKEGRGLLGSLVPGLLSGWNELLAKYGTRSLSDTLVPAIRFADEGFPTSEFLAKTILEAMPRLSRWASSLELLAPGGHPLRAGERFRQPRLAETLAKIASGGIGTFYEGDIGRSLVRFYRDNGGVLSEEDLAEYRPRWHRPLSHAFRDYTVRAAPAPLGDLSFLQGLAYLDAFKPFQSMLDPDYVHVGLESAKLVRRDRDRWLGDAADPEQIAKLLDPDYIRAQAATIGEQARRIAPSRPAPPHTITLVTVDAAGNAVHLMQTIGMPFGTGAMAGETGIVTNGSMYFAHAHPDMPNGIVPGRRLEHNPVVMMAFDRNDRLKLICGSPGGKTRVETVRQMLVNAIDFGMNLQQAVDAPRFIAASDGITAEFEQQFATGAPLLLEKLRQRGHAIVTTDRRFGSGQAVMLDTSTGAIHAAADWREEAVAMAF